MAIAVRICSFYKLMIAMFFYSELLRLEEEKTPFVNDVTHVTYDQELGSTVWRINFRGMFPNNRTIVDENFEWKYILQV